MPFTKQITPKVAPRIDRKDYPRHLSMEVGQLLAGRRAQLLRLGVLLWVAEVARLPRHAVAVVTLALARVP